MDKDRLNARRIEIVKTVEAIDTLLKSKEWQVLRELMFDRLLESLDRQLLSEAKLPKIEESKIYFLQGQIATAKRYDLALYAEKLKQELDGIKKLLS